MAKNPFPVDMIKDEQRREEFLADYERLRERCGDNAMLSTFMLYLLEQKIESDEIFAPGSEEMPRIRNVGYKNTARIIVRLVEKGWMDFYLADFDYLSQQPLMISLGDALLLSQRDGGKTSPGLVSILLKKPSKELSGFCEALNQENLSRAKYVPPEIIKEVFTEIDRRYELK